MKKMTEEQQARYEKFEGWAKNLWYTILAAVIIVGSIIYGPWSG